MMARILVVDDEPRMTALVCGELEDAGHQVTTTTRGTEAALLIDKHAWDLVITDLAIPDLSGMEVLKKALEKEGTDVIMMTAHGSVATAVEAMKAGAADYLLKPFSLEELVLQVRKLTGQQKLKSLKQHYEERATSAIGTDIIGQSPAALRMKRLIEQVAGSDATVLLTGRSGTGKELAAQAIHRLSKRATAPFIAINCAALTETLLESELFGHEKGAFTGAAARKRGRFELAEGGTLFLDEIGEMPLSMQTKLLRVLEERVLIRVGGVDSLPIDVRVVAATNRNLKSEVARQSFREDLYFRLNVFPIEMPTLAERGSDVVLIAEHLLKLARFPHWKLSAEVAGLLSDYDWPGNIRELRNVLERAVILSGGEPLSPDEFSLETESDRQPLPGTSPGGLESAEKQMILQALDKADGNKTEAARLLKITRRRLYSRMKAHDIPLD